MLATSKLSGTAESLTAGSDRPKIECNGVTKRFGGTVALDSVDVHIYPGRIHAIVGENGAGKSTLGKAIAGVHRPDQGTISIDGKPVDLRSPLHALQHSISMVGQELSLLAGRSIVENVFLGIESRRGQLLRPNDDIERFHRLAEEHGFELDPTTQVGQLSVAQQQKVEILRALARDAEVIVMDEPTARLSSDEAASLTASVRRMADAGVTVIYVSHFLDEVLGLADDITVMRNGRIVRSGPAEGETKQSLVEGMVGRSIDGAYPARRSVPEGGKTVLEVRNLSRAGVFENVSFDIAAGEIVTLAGLVGSGRSEVARAVFGADAPTSGSMLLNGQPYKPRSPRAAISNGIAMIPESRRDQALFMHRSVGDNIAMAHLDELSRAGVVNRQQQRSRSGQAADRVQLTGATIDSGMNELSGGNQQKSIFGRWLLSPPTLLIADEPTRGVDVAAKRGIYDLIVDLAEQGMAMLVVSSEIEEVLGISHRILVMRNGSIAGQVDGANATTTDVMNLAFGVDAA